MANNDLKRLAVLTGKAIAKHRIRMGLTQEEVGVRLGIGNEAVSRIERGLRKPNIERLIEFASIFECDLAELLTEMSPRTTEQSARIHDLLAPLAPEDRQLVMEIVERLADRLRS
ncbi:helix-turn-helix domain-containing protein [Pseudomonas sp. GD04087]|uniref:helix-turn-helix domain-containing protein n=1 Tax=Pseudomonas TaxID=286 RepID=UPI0012D9ECEB|nr:MULTISPECIES: helix-turn-helix transcriptional regulator [Pseudomonas]MBH9457372.1 helix-turn-helix transcriptional regulator [Pseudomonas aeruginosa]MBH9467368.1 helix-turn-helix transcriptional regulator [Pseudomonas aeruginosa]MBY1012098.1 helix-turn-helix transcriptional regulator [Pseudomonas aeruginosa]MDH0288671.1 helix-turn-helix domain-containing protein [Pseudomonas sp. GD04087]MDH1049884.1 helix-turn-helix domain-containing protein [Pseudomonas sp. GD03903]